MNKTLEYLQDQKSYSEVDKEAFFALIKLQGEIDSWPENRGGTRAYAMNWVNDKLQKIKKQLTAGHEFELNEVGKKRLEGQKTLMEEREKNVEKYSFRYQRWKDEFEAMDDHSLSLFAYEYIDGQKTNYEHDRLVLAQRELRRRGLTGYDSNGNVKPLNEWVGEAMKENEAVLDWCHVDAKGREVKKNYDVLQEAKKTETMAILHKEPDDKPDIPRYFKISEDLLDFSALENVPEK